MGQKKKVSIISEVSLFRGLSAVLGERKDVKKRAVNTCSMLHVRMYV